MTCDPASTLTRDLRPCHRTAYPLTSRVEQYGRNLCKVADVNATVWSSGSRGLLRGRVCMGLLPARPFALTSLPLGRGRPVNIKVLHRSPFFKMVPKSVFEIYFAIVSQHRRCQRCTFSPTTFSSVQFGAGAKTRLGSSINVTPFYL